MEAEIEKELRSLKGEQQMTEQAIRGVQSQMVSRLKNGMGEDMKKVLNGETKIKLPLSRKVSYKIKSFLKQICGDGEGI